ncbi:leucine-rich repeat-containing protein 37A-like isoform X1 [Lathamus discolor]|uniref:leucine-rich repeat-containing protein 37A-like isoform X1 n=1 Tax=Lathamus discolor TaxID=678569 RepID=UPI0032B7279D
MALLLLVLLLPLLPGLAPGLARPLEPCPGPCRCRGRRLDCSGAALARVPPAARQRPFSVLDFSGNALALIPPQAWKGYPWAEKLVLQHNGLRAVKRRSLEGLLLLRHLDLSYNKIEAIEARAFENLPFLETLNLEGNLIAEIRSDTFRAWHGMQFLQTLLLGHNPLSVIEDTWFFKLPSVTHLDLGATRVTRQTLLMLLLRTSRLETLKLSNDTACCLCQHKHSTETPCRTLRFDCASVCSTSAPRCAPLAETPGPLTGAVPPRKGKSSSTLKIQPKEPSLTEQSTVTLAAVLSLSSPDASAPSPQRLSSRESNTAEELVRMLQSVQHRGWSGSSDTGRFYFLAEGLVAQLKTQLHRAVSILTLKSPSTAQPAQSDEGQEVPAGQGGRATGWEQHEPGLHLTRAQAILWEAAQRLDTSDILPVSGHQRAPPAAQLPTPNPTEAPHLAQAGWSHSRSKALQRTNTADGMEDEEGAEAQEEAPAPTPDSAGTSKEHKLQDSERTVGTKGAEEELPAAESGAEQRLSTMQRFFYALLADNGPPAASSAPEATAAAERSSRGGSPPSAPASTSTHGQHKEQEPPVPTAPGSSSAPGSAATRATPFDSLLRRHLHRLVPDRALRAFMARAARAVREDCGLPQLQPACASMVSRMGLLLKLLSERQRDPEPSELLEQCVREEDAGTSHPRAQAKGMDWEPAETEVAKHTSGHRLLLALSLSATITLITSTAVLVLCCFKVCAKKPAEDSQGSSRWCLRLRRRFQDLRPKWCRRSKDTDRDEEEPSQESPLAEPLWLQYVHQPLEAWQKASLTQLYDGEGSGEEDDSGESGITWLSIGSQPVTAIRTVG